MKQINNIFRYSLLALLTIAVSVGCQKELGEFAPVEKRNVVIEVSVSAGELTRAQSTDMEKVINTLRIYAFYGDKLVGYLDRQQVLTEGEPFYIDLELPASGTHNVEFYVVANEAEMAYENLPISLDRNLSKSDLEAIKFTGLITRTMLPMYCKQTEAINVDNFSGTENSAAGHIGHIILSQKVTLNLTRSLSKLSVYAAKIDGLASNPQILNVNLLAGGTREYSYLFPQTDDILNAVPSRMNNRVLLSSAATISKSIVKSDTAARENAANYNQVFTGVYLPEVVYGSNAWNVSSGNEREAVLHIEYSLGEGQELRNGYVYLPPVQRNHHIKVCILINAEGQIVITYTVAPWDDNATSVYTFAYPTHSYLRENIPTTEAELTAKPSQSAKMSASSPFVGYFQMTAPDSDKWTPTLIGLNASDCSVRVYEGNTDTVIPETSYPIAVSDNWYRIEVHPEVGNMDIGEEVQLAITYTATGLESREFLLINGSHQEYYWPYDGATLQDANYVIITMVN